MDPRKCIFRPWEVVIMEEEEVEEERKRRRPPDGVANGCGKDGVSESIVVSSMS